MYVCDNMMAIYKKEEIINVRCNLLDVENSK